MAQPGPPASGRERVTLGRRIGTLLLAVWFGWCAVVGFVVGTCHDTGGFCTGAFDGMNLVGYVTATAMTALATTFAVLTITRHRLLLQVAPITAAAAVAVLAWSVESGI